MTCISASPPPRRGTPMPRAPPMPRGPPLKGGQESGKKLDPGPVVARGCTLHALCGPDLRPVHPRHFQDIYTKLDKLFPRPPR